MEEGLVAALVWEAKSMIALIVLIFFLGSGWYDLTSLDLPEPPRHEGWYLERSYNLTLQSDQQHGRFCHRPPG